MGRPTGEGLTAVAQRRSIHIEGLSHLSAIPVATRVGPLVVSSVIGPYDAGTRNVPEATEDQLANIFAHAKAMLDEAGATWDDVAKMEFWAPSAEVRAAIDTFWLECFPDESSRPARHTHTGDRPVVTASFLAYVGD
jgi:enamine deaminase RidA (YjgF/YER057c/UK114 family)